MGTEKYTAELKTRVNQGVKSEFERIAEERHLDVSDIAREAFREYLERNPAGQPKLPFQAKKQEVAA